jgi:hypothetical protein
MVFRSLRKGAMIMMRPNWSDDKYGEKMETATAKDAIALLASDSKVLEFVAEALANHDEMTKRGGFAGPSRSQVVRTALAEIINAD